MVQKVKLYQMLWYVNQEKKKIILNLIKKNSLLKWHPTRPIIASISSGVVSIWAQAQVENWSAFAPDFKELDENVEYEERESEFDLEDEDRSPARDNQEDKLDNEDVDVVSIIPNFNYLSSDEDCNDEENALIYLPVTLEIDESDNLDIMDTSIGPLSDVENSKNDNVNTIDIELKNVPKDGKIKNKKI